MTPTVLQNRYKFSTPKHIINIILILYFKMAGNTYVYTAPTMI